LRTDAFDALLSLLTDKIDEEVMQAAGPNLKVIGNYAVGFDNIDLPAAKRHGIAVTNTPAPEVAESVAEHTIMLMLGLAHRLVESDAFARAKKYKGWSPTLLMGNDLGGKTLGIVGTGRIGSSVARRAVLGLGMKCLYEDHRRQPELEKTLGAEPASLEQLLQRADVVSLHVPLTPDTRHMISVAEFALMKKTAFLINTARGPVVDEKALLRALRTKRIAGAALDVFECEPSIDCDLTDKLELKSFDNVIITPHTASATIEARQAMSKLAAENIIAVLSGKPPLNPAK
jgi:glyoxylate reductase